MKKEESKKYKNICLHIVGKEGEIMLYSEIKQLLDYFEDKGYLISFIKKEQGWIIEIQKQ